MKIGITCYPTYGGSSTIASELGLELIKRGHEVHFICYDLPIKIKKSINHINFHKVDVVSYPLFRFPPYTLALASKMYECINTYKLDILHVHYAIPHSTSAYLAREMTGCKNTKIITTLHGTDIRLLGLDPSYRDITRFSIEKSDGITAVSEYLKEVTIQQLNVSSPIKVIYNFVDIDKFKSIENKSCKNKPKIITHISNFRPIKNLPHIIQSFFLIQQKIPARLQLVGDGPERHKAECLVKTLKIQNHVDFLGERDDIENILGISDLLLLLSESESFGLAAIEAMSAGVPVIATNVGGLPEIIKSGKNGYLVETGDISKTCELALKILKDNKLQNQMRTYARKFVKAKFSLDKIVSQYEQYYEEVFIH
ncbi:N-acetyl-alpha-D-glucosaminyl L-malate synthase BshA [Candidatus Poribacteria bacterium]|nr:N-acetyl-alpha-D-glucosaminyl L-malate synthase BshA [Candidatus Poribacteria bacterium]